MKKLEEIFEDIEPEEKEKAKLLFQELSFCIETAKDLKEQIKKEGSTEHFINGKQNFRRENPSLTAYNKLMKTYNSLFQTLLKMKKKEVVDEFEDDFDTFLED